MLGEGEAGRAQGHPTCSQLLQGCGRDRQGGAGLLEPSEAGPDALRSAREEVPPDLTLPNTLDPETGCDVPSAPLTTLGAAPAQSQHLSFLLIYSHCKVMRGPGQVWLLSAGIRATSCQETP